MRPRSSFLILLVLASRLPAQTAAPVAIDPPPGPALRSNPDPVAVWPDAQAGVREPLASNRNFSNFIGFISNPLQNIDPRSLTQVVPIFLGSQVSTGPALPDLSGQVYGPAFSLALTDRFSVGLNQGGFASINIDRNDPRFPLLNRLLRNRGQEFGGNRDGFLNLGGYAQYTFIEDVENQFLATAGMRVVAPAGSYELFQGKGPAILAPYLTVGKELGNFHVLATTGYQFPARSGDTGTELFYLNAHLDRQCFGWVYPLVEVNWIATHLLGGRGPADAARHHRLRELLVHRERRDRSAAGVNLVLVRDRLELGAVYTRSVSTTAQHRHQRRHREDGHPLLTAGERGGRFRRNTPVAHRCRASPFRFSSSAASTSCAIASERNRINSSRPMSR